jgi:hypothetical protein
MSALYSIYVVAVILGAAAVPLGIFEHFYL